VTGNGAGSLVHRMGREWLVEHRRSVLKLNAAEMSRRMGIGESTVHRWETGHVRHLSPESLRRISQVYGLRLHRVVALEEDYQRVCLSGPDRSLRSLSSAVAELVAGGPAIEQGGPRAAAPLRVTAETVSGLESLVTGLRRLDDTAGGDAVLPVVSGQLGYVKRLVGRRLSTALGRRLGRAAADFCQLAGWVAFDTGLHATARECWSVALRAADGSGDRELAAHVIACRAWQDWSLGTPKEGLARAQEALDRLALGDSTRVRGLVVLRRALCLAEVGDRQGCERDLAWVEDLLGEAEQEEPPAWLYYLDRPRLDYHAGLCWMALDDHERAERAVSRAASKHESAFTRVRALAWCAVARMRAAGPSADVDQVVEAAHHALDLAWQVGSVQVDTAVGRLAELMGRWPDEPAAKEVVARYHAWLGAPI
jgi:transcriptional regulator with XRE-family HTH domain